jgi:hypothetical protein
MICCNADVGGGRYSHARCIIDSLYLVLKIQQMDLRRTSALTIILNYLTTTQYYQ